jgi:hypothetical protein
MDPGTLNPGRLSQRILKATVWSFGIALQPRRSGPRYGSLPNEVAGAAAMATNTKLG